jgi:hypothetical protein
MLLMDEKPYSKITVSDITEKAGIARQTFYRIFRDLQKYPMSLIKQFKGKLSADEYLIGRYKLCYQITGFLSLFSDWFINDMPMPVEKLISMINSMNTPKTIQLRNIPSILVKLKNE